MRHAPIAPLIRTQNGKQILKGFPSLIARMDRQLTATFALGFNGGADDRWSLGPFPGPGRIVAVTHVCSLIPDPARYFTVHVSTDAQAVVLYPTDRNLLDPISPSQYFTPGLQGVTVNMAFAVDLPKWWLKLSRYKGGAINFELTCSVMIRQVD